MWLNDNCTIASQCGILLLGQINFRKGSFLYAIQKKSEIQSIILINSNDSKWINWVSEWTIMHDTPKPTMQKKERKRKRLRKKKRKMASSIQEQHNH